MKKLISLLLVMLMLLSQSTAIFAAETLEIPAKYGDWYFSYITVINNKIYAPINRYILQFDDAKKDFVPIALIDDGSDVEWANFELYAEGEDLLAYNRSDLTVSTVKIEGTKATLIPKYDLKKAGFKLEDGAQPNQLVITENSIYTNYYDMEANAEKLVRINKSDMSTTDIPLPENTYLQEMAPYKDDMFYYRGYTQDGGAEVKYVEGTEIKVFATIPKTEANITAIKYNKFADKFYVFDQNFAYTVNSESVLEKAAFVSVPEYTASQFIDAETFYYIDNKELKNIKFTGQKLPEQFIKISGLEDMRIIKKYNELNPTNPAIRVSGYIDSVNTAANQMKSPEAADVYFFESYTNLETLYKHKYLHPLTSSEKIKAAVERMYPFIQNAVKFDGDVYLLPYNLYNYGSMAPINRYAYSDEVFKDMGLTEADVPQTYGQFLDFINRYQNELSTQYKDVEFIQNMPYYNMFWNMATRILNTINLASIKDGQSPNYNTPAIQELFAKLEKTDFYGFYDPKENNEYEYNEKKAIFSETNGLIDISKGFTPITLKLDENSAPLNVASMTAVAVNELSQNKDNAMAFVEFILDNLDQKKQTLLYTDVNEPVKQSYVDAELERTNKLIEETKAAMEKDKAEGGKNQKALQEELDSWELNLKYTKENLYDLTEEEIKKYNEIADTFVVITSNVFDYSSEQINSLLQRYFDKNIGSQEFLAELDRYIKMMTLEGN